MNKLTALLKAGVFTASVAGALVATTSIASADVVCNRFGDCWHVSQRYATYPTELGIQFYNDDWRASHLTDRHYHWRSDQKDDHGYYENGNWHGFDKDRDADGDAH